MDLLNSADAGIAMSKPAADTPSAMTCSVWLPTLAMALSRDDYAAITALVSEATPVAATGAPNDDAGQDEQKVRMPRMPSPFNDVRLQLRLAVLLVCLPVG